MATLKVISASGSGQSMEIDHEIVVGREGADLAIDDAEVSRRHAAIRPVDGGVEVEDLGSKNGTLIEGKRITGKLVLTSSERVQIGGTEIRIEMSLARPTTGPMTREHDKPVADAPRGPAVTRARDRPVADPQRTHAASAPPRTAGPAATRVTPRPEASGGGGGPAVGSSADERESAKAALIMALAGGVIGVVGSAAHPQPSPDELNVKAFLDTIVPSDSWVLLHLLILFSLFVGAAALVLLARSLARGPGALLARVGALVLIAATAMGGVWMLLDGLAMKAIADDWAASTGAAHIADERAAIAIEHFILALFSAWLVFWQGVPYVCFGLACIQDGRFPMWAGVMGAAIGAMSFVLGLIQFYTERDALITHTLMPPVSVLGGIWLPIIVYLWWRQARAGPGGSREPGVVAGAGV